MIVIVSYREEYEQRCTRSCHCLHGSNSSSFEIHTAETEDDAASWLAKRLMSDEHASFNNIVFDSFEQLEIAGHYAYSRSASKGVESIDVYHGTPFKDDANWEHSAREESRLGALQERLVRLTKSRLEDILADRKKAEEQKEAVEAAAREAEQRKRDEAELARLQQKLGKA